MGDNFHPQDNQMPMEEDSNPVGNGNENGGLDNPVVGEGVEPHDETAAAVAAAGLVVAPPDTTADTTADTTNTTETAVDGTATAAALVNANQIPPQPVDNTGMLDAPPVDGPVQLQQVPVVQVPQYQPLVDDAHVEANAGAGAGAGTVTTTTASAADTAAATAGAGTTVDGETLHIEIPMHHHDPNDPNVAGANVNIVHHHHHEDDGTGVMITQAPHDGTEGVPTGMEAMPALTIPSTAHAVHVHAQQQQQQPPTIPVHMHQITAATAGLSAAASSLIATPTKPSTKQERMDAIWMKHYKELQEYKAQHGHVRVPRKSGPLGEWVRTQRRYYKLWRRGESVPLTKERMELLDHLGFVWLPAEEKVGGGFRGGRPKKRKREEEDALAAANAAAAAAAVAAGGHTNPAFFHHLASPAALSAAANTTLASMHGMEGIPPTPTPVESTGHEGEEDVVAVATVDNAGAGAVAATPEAGPPPTSVHTGLPVPMGVPVYTYHHDPFHFQSMSKRSDIANQINLLSNHQPLNRQHMQGPKVEYATQGLTDAHAHYEDVVYVLKRSNEELRDAELALDRAKKTYDQAQALKDKADALLANASEEVLKAELEEGSDEWIAMYKCLIKYQEQNGNILFPRLSNNDKNSGNGPEQAAAEEEGHVQCVSYGTVGVDQDGEIVGTVNGGDKVEESGVTVEGNEDGTIAAAAEETAVTPAPQDVAAATADTKLEEGTKDETMEESAVSVAAAVAAASSVQIDEVTAANGEGTEEAKKEDAPQPMDVDTSADQEKAVAASVGDVNPATIPVHVTTGTVEVTEPLLHDWVSKMRKFPKKQFKKWRRYALDKLGFVW